MDVAFISALAALAGSVVGGLTSGITTWLSQRAQAKAGQLAHDMSRREELYKDFIVAASKTYGGAIVSNEAKDSGSCPPLCHDQQNARPVFAANRRVR